MQYFLGYSSFTNEAPFDAFLFVEFRKRLGFENLNAINERIVALKIKAETRQSDSNPVSDSNTKDSDNQPNAPLYVTHKGRVIMDATACPQNIAYPTDLNLLNDAREKLEEHYKNTNS